VQRVAKHKEIQQGLIDLKQALQLFEVPDMTEYTTEVPAKSDGDEFLDVEEDSPEDAAASQRTHAHVVHVKTRCWSAVDSIEMLFNLREANNKYFEKFTEDAQMNLSQSEYIAVSHMLGVYLNVVEVQRYIEGDKYDTGSISHPLAMMLRAHFASGKIKCPQLQNPQLSKKKKVRVEDMSKEGKMVLAKMICELKSQEALRRRAARAPGEEGHLPQSATQVDGLVRAAQLGR